MHTTRILIVDDEPAIVELLDYSLSDAGFQTRSVTTGEGAVKAARTEQFDLILLDLMLPGIDGKDVLQLLRGNDRTKDIPVIMLTARGSEEDIVNGLEAGADDYITKPFSLKVLHARIKAVLGRRERTRESSGVVRIGSVLIDALRKEVTINGMPITLTATEFAILSFLSENPGWVFTRTQIINGVKGSDYPVTERSVDVQILNLRKKLGEYGRMIETVRGIGYRIKEHTD